MDYLYSLLPKFDKAAEVKRQQELFDQLTEQTNQAEKQIAEWELFRKTVVEQLSTISTKEFELSQILGQFKIDLESCPAQDLPKKLQEITRVVKVLLEAREWIKSGKEIKALQEERSKSRTTNNEIMEQLGALEALVEQKKKTNERAGRLTAKLHQSTVDIQQILDTPKKTSTSPPILPFEQSEY